MTVGETSSAANPADGPLINRRALVAKGGVAGGLLWVTPTIHASRASAAGCTPKCAPTSPSSVSSNVVGFCPEPGNKAAKVSLKTNSSSACNCQNPVGTATGCLVIPTTWEKDGTGQTVTVGTATPEAGFTVAFYVAKPGGSLGQGHWVAQTPLRFGLTCLDKDGGKVGVFCDFNVSFDFDPSGSCGSPSNVAVTATGTCGTVCVTDACGNP
jgi:hypothetical protein